MELEQINFPKRHWEEPRICDGCEVPFEDDDIATVYISDTAWIGIADGELPGITPQGMYCLNCYTGEIPLPHLGTNEGFICVVNEYDNDSEEYSYTEKGIIKGSTKSNGIDWDPISLVEDLYPPPRGMIQHSITPLSVFFMFERLGVDLRGFIKDGELVIPDNIREKLDLIMRTNIQHEPYSIWDPEML